MPKPKGDAFAAVLNKPKPQETEVETPSAVQAAPTTQRPIKPARSPQSKPKASTRQGTTFVGGHFPREVNLQLKMLGLETGQRTTQELVAEALDLLFQSYGKPTIAKRPKDEA